MQFSTTHRRVAAVLGIFVVVALVLTGIWILVRDDGTTQPPAASAPTASPEVTRETSPSAAPRPVPATMTVKVYFHRGEGADPTHVVALHRSVPRSPKVATAALSQLVAGPTSKERAAGYWSHFSSATKGMLRSVRINDRVGYADFRDLRLIIPNASSSAGSAALLAELDATFKQFGTVRTTVYSLNGDVPAFYEWLQMEPPSATAPTLAEARRVAARFLTTVVGMKRLSCQGARWRSDYVATVDFRTRIGEGQPVAGPVTQVHLGKTKTSFWVFAVTTDTIRVDEPASAISAEDVPVVTSPVTVRGSGVAFEGTVTLRMVELTGSGTRRLGAGYATGGGDLMRPFTGQVAFVRPRGDNGWVLALELSAHDGEITKATAVRVFFDS